MVHSWRMLLGIVTLSVLGSPLHAVDDQASLCAVPLNAANPSASLQALRVRGATVVRMLGRHRALIDWPGAALPPTASPWRPSEAAKHLSGLLAAKAGSSGDELPVAISVMPRHAARMAELARDHGAVIRWSDVRPPTVVFGMRVSAAALASMLDSGDAEGLDVVLVDLAPGARLLNDRSVWRCQSGAPGSTPLFERGLRGENQLIAIMDTGIDPDHCFFADDVSGLPVGNDDRTVEVDPDHRKIAAVNFWWDRDWPAPGPGNWDDNGHGSHVAGTAAGDGARPGLHDGADGMAPAARLIIQDGGAAIDDCGDLPGLGCPMRPLDAMLEQAWRQGARIHSNSWGDEENFLPFGRYTERTADIDGFVWEHQDMVVVAAAGNSGGFGEDSVISPSTGKNVLSVGATVDASSGQLCPASYSSRGWTQDGRIKPDVLAPGSGVRSALTDGDATTGNCDELVISGTSMAAPAVAGLAALVRQYFVEGRYLTGTADSEAGFEPSSALVRAVLIAAARDLRELGCVGVAPPPSRDQGWGFVQLDRALWWPERRHRMVVFDDRMGLHEGGRRVFERTVASDDVGRLEVVLVWSDPPSTAAAESNLIHDLDLEVIDPDGRIYRGNVFSEGVSVADGTADRVNPVEVVRLPAAPAGSWTVRVQADSTALGWQPFAVVVVGQGLRSDAPRLPDPAGRASGT
jgi:hypothetical protein